MQDVTGAEDPVVAEVDVLLSHGLSRSLYLLQFPLRPAHLPYDGGWVRGARVRPETRQVRLDVAILPHGENYSRSRGESYARDAEMGKASPTGPAEYESGLMDRHTLTSPPLHVPHHAGQRYVAGVLKDGELHVTGLEAVVQLRPTLQHLDRAAAGRKRSGTGEGPADGEITESEGEEVKPVTVKFARRETGSSSSRLKRPSYSEQLAQAQEEEGWVNVNYQALTSHQANVERRLLFCTDDAPAYNLCSSPQAYLDLLCPRHTEEEVGPPSEPQGVVSLSRLKSLPVPQQVQELLCKVHLIQLSKLCNLVQCGRGQVVSYLDALQEYGVLVQGCWVLASHHAHSKPEEVDVRTVRDYILYCFTQTRTLARRDIVVITKVPHETVRQIMAPLTSNGWDFKLATDFDFINKHSHIVRQQEEKWRRRHEQLRAELGLPRETTKSKPSPGGEEARRRGKLVAPAKMKEGTIANPAFSSPRAQQGQPQVATPPLSSSIARGQEPATSPQPLLNAVNMKKEEEEEEDREDGSLERSVVSCCQEILERGVLPLTHIMDRLNVRKSQLPRTHPLSSASLTEHQVEVALNRMGAVQVGQPSGQKLFANHRPGTAGCEYRAALLKLFQTQKWLRKKQILEEMARECGQPPEARELTSMLKEYAYCKGTQWHLLGT